MGMSSFLVVTVEPVTSSSSAASELLRANLRVWSTSYIQSTTQVSSQLGASMYVFPHYEFKAGEHVFTFNLKAGGVFIDVAMHGKDHYFWWSLLSLTIGDVKE